MSLKSILKLRHSGLVDDGYYNTQAKSDNQSLDSALHYFEHGAALGLNPHLLFDTTYYFEQCLELRQSKGNPLIHFLEHGSRLKLNPHPLFNTSYYLACNPDVAQAGTNPLLHFLNFGANEGRNPHPLFQTNFYLDQLRQSEKGGVNGLVHYLQHGAFDGLDPNPLFDSSFYLRNKSDLRKSRTNPLVHFVRVGASELFDPHPFFDIEFYLAKNAGLRESGVNPLEHFILIGVAEGRLPNKLFDSSFYADNFQAVQSSGINPLVFLFSDLDRSRFEQDYLSKCDRPYQIPLFLSEKLPEPLQAGNWRTPTLTPVACQLCTANQFDEIAYQKWCQVLCEEPRMHRKQWEYVFILEALEQTQMINSGKRGLGFGTGTEPLPSAFASYGISVCATDAPRELGSISAWSNTDQHIAAVESLWIAELLSREQFESLVRFMPVNMNDIPSELNGFDFCWSSCALEHLGSINAGLSFIENSLQCLRPGGVAVHTTEFNLNSNDETLETETLCLFRKKDIVSIMNRLSRAGHEVFPLNFHPGSAPLDRYVDLPPFALPHLKLLAGGFTTTSIGLIVRKRQTV